MCSAILPNLDKLKPPNKNNLFVKQAGVGKLTEERILTPALLRWMQVRDVQKKLQMYHLYLAYILH